MINFFKRFHDKSEPYEARLPGGTPDAFIDTDSPTWKYIEVWANGQLDAARKENDFLKLTEIRTAALRGKIKLLKQLISLPTGVVKEKDD
jgi:hypothetical protein